MRLTLTSLALTLALAASAAPTAPVTKALPARFGLTTITAEPRANGLRLRVSANGSQLSLNVTGDVVPSVDAIFLSGRGRIALDLSVHTNPMGSSPPRPAPPALGDWNFAFLPRATALQIVSEQFQAVLDSWGPEWHATVATWAQDDAGRLRLLDDKGGVVTSGGFRLCGEGAGAYVPRWDEEGVACAALEFGVVAL